MAQSRDLRQQIEQLVERAQDEVLDASRQLATGITKRSERVIPPFSHDIERVVDEVFDFAERVMKGQRKMVNDMVKTINEQSRRAAEAGRTATAPRARKAPAKRTPAKKAAKRTPAKKRPANR
jgi:phosphate uptake regulator